MLDLETFNCTRCNGEYKTWRLTAPFKDKSLRGKVLNSYMCEVCNKEIEKLIISDFRKKFVNPGKENWGNA